MKLIMENWRKYNDNPFQLMCEQYDKNILTETQLFENWKEMTLQELDKLNEIDWEKEAELTADPDYKTPQERKQGALLKAKEKINDWILEKSIQIVELGKRAAVRAIKSVAWLVKKIQGFCDNHPLICKIAIMTLTIVAFYIAMAFLFENEAQAKIYRKGKPLSDNVVNIMKGQLSDIIDMRTESDPYADRSELYKVLANIDEMHQSKTRHEIFKSKDKIDKALNSLFETAADMYQGEGSFEKFPEKMRHEKIMAWQDIGERVKAWYKEVTLKGEGSMYKSVDYGKTIAKKAAERN